MTLDHSASLTFRHPRSSPLAHTARRLLLRLREAQAAQVELHERMLLRQQPWLEDYLHWSLEDGEWQLHGTRPPLPDGRRRSVTSSGWCPGRRH